MNAVNPDISGWCRANRCDTCTGRLLSQTGYHWWCICRCHPDVPMPTKPDHAKAWHVWDNARRRHPDPDEQSPSDQQPGGEARHG